MRKLMIVAVVAIALGCGGPEGVEHYDGTLTRGSAPEPASVDILPRRWVYIDGCTVPLALAQDGSWYEWISTPEEDVICESGAVFTAVGVRVARPSEGLPFTVDVLARDAASMTFEGTRR